MKQKVLVLVCGVLLLPLLTLPASAAERDGCFSTEQWFTGVFRLSEKAGCSSRQRLQQRNLFSPVTTNYAFSMQAGEQTAYLSGTLANGQTVVREKIVLSSVPRVLDDVFYLPLEDVISALGGVCLVDGTTARVLLLGQHILRGNPRCCGTTGPGCRKRNRHGRFSGTKRFTYRCLTPPRCFKRGSCGRESTGSFGGRRGEQKCRAE